MNLRAFTVVAGMALAAAAIAVLPAANAQTQAPSAQSPSAQSPAAIPEQKLASVAVAVQKVTTIRRDYEQKMSGASGDDQQKIATEANTALSKAVTDQGLSLDEFNSIIRMAQNDPGMREKILQKMKPGEVE
jgi:curli biogenesis system outer membrane secretion channel CsgG